MITVVIPCYRARSTVDRAIVSILQSENALALVVDDACPEGTGAYVEAHYAGEPRVKVVRNKENLGLGATRNVGIDRTETDFITFLDADDYWSEGPQIAAACDAMLEAGTDVGLMPIVVEFSGNSKPAVYPDYELISPHVGNVIDIASTQALSVIQPCWSMIYRRKFLVDNRIRFQRRKFEDHDFGLEVVLKAKSLLALRMSPIVHYDKTRQGTLTSTQPDEVDHRLVLEHVARVTELIEARQDLTEQFRAERAIHYTFRILFSLLDTAHPGDGLIVESYHQIIRLRSICLLPNSISPPEFQSSLTRQMLSRHPYLLRALEHALVNQRRFVHFVHLLRFVRSQPTGKARLLARLGLRIASKPWR